MASGSTTPGWRRGAHYGALTDLPTWGSAHPGFSLMLKAWTQLVGGTTAYAIPALVASILGPPAVYLGLRWRRFAPSVAALLAAILVVADIHTLYAGHVKPYTLDFLVVLVLALVLPSLAELKSPA